MQYFERQDDHLIFRLNAAAQQQTGLPDRRDLIPPPPLRKEFSTNGYQKRPFPEPSGKNAQRPC